MQRPEVLGAGHAPVARGGRQQANRGGGGIMRYFLLIFAVCAVAMVGIAGRRGGLTRRTPLYVFPDMRRQLKLRPQEPNGFFANGISSQLRVGGTIPRGKPIQTASGPVYPYEDSPVFTGFVAGTTN